MPALASEENAPLIGEYEPEVDDEVEDAEEALFDRDAEEDICTMQLVQ